MTVFISELRFENNADFVEIVATDGEDVSGYSIAVYRSSGSVESVHSLAGEYDSSLAGNDGYLIDRGDGLPDMGNNWGVALIDDLGNVVQFLSGDFAITAVDGPAAGETSIGLGNITSGGQSVETTDFGSTYGAQSTPNPGVIPCFAPGTMIRTPLGPRPVEALRPGDLVDTLDSGALPVRWVRRNAQWLDGPRQGNFPILVAAGALGPGRPEQDLVLSPQHRVLVGGGGQLETIFAGEYFAPAKALTGLPGIREMCGRTRITWVHYAFESHQVVFSNGSQTESLLLGPMVRRGLAASEIRDLDAIFGAPSRAGWNGAPARPCLQVNAARRTIEAWRARQAARPGNFRAGAGHRDPRPAPPEAYKVMRNLAKPSGPSPASSIVTPLTSAM
jgi:hypothetical protein